MAPELIMALVEDEEGKKPELTKSSDVYAFASVCLEVSCSLFYFFFGGFVGSDGTSSRTQTSPIKSPFHSGFKTA